MTAPRASLAARQAELVAALVAGGPTPPGFDPVRIQAAADALLRKRCGEVARAWPALLRDAGTPTLFVQWAAGRPKTTSWADGLAFAEQLDAAGELPPLAVDELRAAWRGVRSASGRRRRRRRR